VRLEGRKAVLQAFISILAQPHRETHRNDRRRWVSGLRATLAAASSGEEAQPALVVNSHAWVAGVSG
jgi:hypothetical protein